MFARLLARAPPALARAHHVSALPSVRKAAPAFTAGAVVNGAFKSVSLKDYAGKYCVLFWYPLDFTFVCPTEITAFSDRAKEFSALNTEVVGISIDSCFSHLAWINTPRTKGGLGPMAIPLIGDISKEVSRAYGMVVEDPADDMNGVTLRGTVIVSPAGKVLHVSNTDAPVGRSVDEVLRLIQAFQYVEKHGEVCPAGWKPGQKTVRWEPERGRHSLAARVRSLCVFTPAHSPCFLPHPAPRRGYLQMKADPKGSQEYFSTLK